MSIDWISVSDRVPENRRQVLAWGLFHAVCGISMTKPQGCFLGATKFNPSRDGGEFDAEKGRFVSVRVTHWAEINGPVMRGGVQPTRPWPR